MEVHRGNELEKVIRKKGINISDLARKIGVSRRSLYNWFREKNLKLSIVEKISGAIDYDHKINYALIINEKGVLDEPNIVLNSRQEVDYWRDKYILLLERHVQVLSEEECK